MSSANEFIDLYSLIKNGKSTVLTESRELLNRQRRLLVSTEALNELSDILQSNVIDVVFLTDCLSVKRCGRDRSIENAFSSPN